MDYEVANYLQTVFLSSDDIDEIFALYALARSATPYGFLATRTKDDFREIFRKPEEVIGTGIRDNGRLIAYSVCHRVTTNLYSENPLLSTIEPTASTVYHGDGTVVHPAYHGRMLTQRISRLRFEQIAERRIDHVVGLIAADNIVSIGNAVLAGALLVGFAHDDTSLNYIAYAGCFRDRLRNDAMPITVGWKDHKQQQRLFAERNVICDLSKPSTVASSIATTVGDRQFAFRPVE